MPTPLSGAAIDWGMVLANAPAVFGGEVAPQPLALWAEILTTIRAPLVYE